MAKRPVKTHSFNGVVYDIDITGPIDGRCESPHECGNPTLAIYTKEKTLSELEALIHESLHAEGWAKTEKVIERTAKEIARFLWRLNFRR